MKTLTVEAIKGMKVVELRKTATQFAIKNPSQYKRVQLESLIIDCVVAEAKKAQATKKKAVKVKATKKMDTRVKAEKVSDEQVQAIANVLAQTVIKREVSVTDLMATNRKVLIRVMKALQCKNWYRTYDKATMVQLIIGATA